MAIVGPSKVALSDSLNFTTTRTLRDQFIDVNNISGYVIDLNGNIYDNGGGSTVTLVGGLDTFVNEKVYRDPKFYITVRQKIALYNICKLLARRMPNGNITSDVQELEAIVQPIYANAYG